MPAHRPEPGAAPEASAERGSALLLALVLIIVLTFLGFGLLTRSLLVSRIAGEERYSTKAFYAADSGLSVAQARLRLRIDEKVDFSMTELRRGSQTGQIEVAVSDMSQVGTMQPVVGTQTSGGQGGGEAMFLHYFKGTSNARQALTRTERQVTSIICVGPMPPFYPE
mgnify:CR=1 FL=1